MVWTSLPASLPLKRDRAILLLLATASLLERSGERVRLLSPAGTVDLPPGGGRIANRIALALLTLLRKPASAGLPPYAALPTHAQLVMASDLIAPASEISTLFRQLAGNGIRAHILQIFDPAEYELPYAGRIRFEGLEGEPDVVLPAVETLREDFATLFNRQQSELRALAERCLHVFQPHRTDMSAATALLTLSTSLTGHRVAGRS